MDMCLQVQPQDCTNKYTQYLLNNKMKNICKNFSNIPYTRTVSGGPKTSIIINNNECINNLFKYRLKLIN